MMSRMFILQNSETENRCFGIKIENFIICILTFYNSFYKIIYTHFSKILYKINVNCDTKT